MDSEDSDLIKACAALLAIEQTVFPYLSDEALRGDVECVVSWMAEAQAPHVDTICSQTAGTWGGLLAKARAALQWSAAPSDSLAPVGERLLGALLRDIESAALGREIETLTQRQVITAP